MNARPIKTSPNANFVGLDGCLLPMRIHSHEKIGARIITKVPVNDWRNVIGKLVPKI
jgi:hypothetical protein